MAIFRMLILAVLLTPLAVLSAVPVKPSPAYPSIDHTVPKKILPQQQEENPKLETKEFQIGPYDRKGNYNFLHKRPDLVPTG